MPSPLRQTIKLRVYPNPSCSNRVYSLSFKHAVILWLSLSVRCRSGHSCINTAWLVNKTCFIPFLHSVPQFLRPSAPHFLGPCTSLPHGPSAPLSLYLFVSSHIRSSVHTRVFILERECVIQILSYLHIYIYMYIHIYIYICRYAYILNIQIYIYICIHRSIHIYIHKHEYIYIHIYI